MRRNVARPGKKWRIISFIPGIGWFSVAYLGVSGSNVVAIICACVYAAATFASSSSALIMLAWIAGIVHYAVLYRRYTKNKAANKLHSPENKNRQEATPPPVRKQSVQNNQVKQSVQTKKTTYTQVTIPGSVEQRQRVPRRPAQSQSSPVNTTTRRDINRTSRQRDIDPTEKFFLEMKKYDTQRGDPAPHVPFQTYWPTYDSMSKEQKAWYFFWRSHIRQGNAKSTDLSYIFVHIYELLSGIGWQTPEEGYRQLMFIWRSYHSEHPSLDSYLSNWVFDFCLLYQLPLDTEFLDMLSHVPPSDLADYFVTSYENTVPLKLPLPLLDSLTDYSIASSKFYREGHGELMDEAIPRVVALVDASLRKETGKGILAKYGPNRTKKRLHFLFNGAKCPKAHEQIELNLKNFSGNSRLRAYLNEVVRYGENSLRKLYGARGRLRGITMDEQMGALIDGFLAREYGTAGRQVGTAGRQVDASPQDEPKITLDLDRIEKLRAESDQVRSALAVEAVEGGQSGEKQLLTDLPEMIALLRSISPSARGLLDQLKRAGWSVPSEQSASGDLEEINRSAIRHLGRPLIACENTMLVVDEDYLDELEHIHQHPQLLGNDQSVSAVLDVTKLPEQWQQFLQALMQEHQRALYAVLVGDAPGRALEEIASESMTMPQILLDELNQAAIEELGDIIIDMEGDQPVILEEYREALMCAIV